MTIKPPVNAQSISGNAVSTTLGFRLSQIQEAKAASVQSVLSKLSAGQQIQATILNLSGNQLTLKLASSSISPKSSLLVLDIKQLLRNPDNQVTAFKKGAQIQLQVIKTGNASTILLTPLPNTPEQQLTEAIKRLLPIRTPVLPLLSQLQQILPQLQTDADVSSTLKNLAQQILYNLPTRSELAPSRIKYELINSGLLLESKLAALLTGKMDVSLQNDLKLNIAKLILLLKQELSKSNSKTNATTLEILKEGRQKAQSALAGLTLDQISSLPTNESLKQNWIFELPFLNRDNADSVKLEIKHGKKTEQDNTQKNWIVNITINPPNLGIIRCQLSCYDGSINTRFQSDAGDTVALIDAHLDYLKQQFENKGLSTGFMDAQQGQTTPTDGSKTPITQLVSEKA